MNADILLDAIGLIDDRFVVPQEAVSRVSWRRTLSVALAAVLILALCMGTVMAVSPQFRDLVFAIFRTETHEQPPAGNADSLPTEPGLQELDVVNFDGVVNAQYFTSDGLVLTCNGGFYTCSQGAFAPDDAAFWEIRPEGIVEVDATRIDFPLTQGNRTLEIIFDYAVLGGRLNIKVWPQGLDNDPVGNGWNVTPIGSRTDAALLTVPVLLGDYYTHDFLLLDLTTLETRDLLESIPLKHVAVDACQLTSDLHYGLIMGTDMESGDYGYWICDLEKNTISPLDVSDPYLLNDETIIFRESLGDGLMNIVRLHIPTGIRTEIVRNAAYRGIWNTNGTGAHGLIYHTNSITLVDLRTCDTLELTGLNPEKLTASESLDGSRIMIAYQETNDQGELGYGFSSLGILNPETGVLQMLTREVSGNPETFWGWLNRSALVITAQDVAEGYYVYVYEFGEYTATP